MHAVRFGLLILVFSAVTLPEPAPAQRPNAQNAVRQKAGNEVTPAAGRVTAAGEQSSGQVRQVVDNSPGRGILGRLFNSGPSSNRTSAAKKDDGRRVIEAIGPSEPPDWTGVPYHDPSPATAARDARPLSDPGSRSSRIAQRTPTPQRTTTPRRTTASPTAPPIPVPRSQADARASRRSVAESRETPAVPSTNELITSTFRPLSETESSRRSRRRSVQTLDIEPSDAAESTSNENLLGDSSSSRRNRGTSTAAGTPEPTVARRSLPPTSGQLPPTQPQQQVAQQQVAQEQVAQEQVAEPEAGQPAGETFAANSNGGRDRTQERVAEGGPDARVAQATPQAPKKSVPSTQPADPAPIEWRPANPENTGTVAGSPASNRRRNQLLAPEQAVSAPQFGTPATTASVAQNQVAQNQVAQNQVAQNQVAESKPDSSPATNNASETTPTAVKDLGVTPNLEGPATVTNSTAVNTAAVNVSSEIPGLRVVTKGPADIPVRHASRYEISVENLGSLAAPGAAIQVKLPTWIQLQNIAPSRGEIARQDDAKERQLLWVVEGLAAGQVEKLSLELVAQEAKQFDVDVEWAVVPQSNKARVSVREPALQLIIDGPEQITYGTSETYTVRVLNPGNGPANNVVFTLSPNSATPQTQRVNKIEPGKEAKFEVELTARDLEDLQIHGLATADLNLKQEEIKLIKVVSAKLQAVLTGPPVKYQDAIAEYRLQVSNSGNSLCTNAVAMLELPRGLKYLSGLEAAEVAGNQIRWEIASLEPGQTMEFAFRCQMQQTGQHRLQFSCRGSAAGVTTVEFDTRVEALADLVLTIDDPVAPAPVGEEVTYQITVLNRGSKAAEQVSLLAQFSHDIEPIRIAGGEGTIEPGQVKFSQIPTLAAGESLRLKVTAKAEKPGHHRFRAEVTCGDTLLVAEEATRYLELGSQRVSRRSDDPTSDR